jgi:hypothetical protein
MLFQLLFGLFVQSHLGVFTLKQTAVSTLVSLVPELLLARKLRVVVCWMSVLAIVASPCCSFSCRTLNFLFVSLQLPHKTWVRIDLNVIEDTLPLFLVSREKACCRERRWYLMR